jgi:hypothetical protein
VRPTDIVARYGGEEFCAVPIGVNEPEATRIAERLRAAVAAQAFDVRGRGHRITVSIGVAAFRDGDLQVPSAAPTKRCIGPRPTAAIRSSTASPHGQLFEHTGGPGARRGGVT